MAPTSAGPDAAVRTQEWTLLEPAERERCLRANVEALAERGALGSGSIDRVLRAGLGAIAASGMERTKDGALRWCVGGDHPCTRWDADAEQIVERARSAMKGDRGAMLAPLVLCGFASPSAARGLFDLLRELDPPYLFRRRLLVVHECESSLGAALSAGAFEGLILDSACAWFLGPDALGLLRAWFDERSDDGLPKRLVHTGDHGGTTAGAGAPLAVRAAELIRARAAAQGDALGALRAENEAWCGAASFERSRGVLREAALGARLLRVLVCTSRHSTYTAHAAEGLRAALVSQGHEAELMLERDSSTIHTNVSYARAVARVRPDLIVMVNYTRGIAQGAIPKTIPFVTWIQDQMAHLSDEEAGAQVTGWDFTAGAVAAQLWERYGHRAEMAMPYPVPASASRFHERPVDPARAERYACDVAFVSNHSETPERLHDRLRERFGGASASVVDALWEECPAIVDRAMSCSPAEAAPDAVRRCFSRVTGREPSQHEADILRYQYLEPVMGRLFRHQAVEAAARVCERRGWELRLFGNGWDAHPTLSARARPMVSHGEELRACYATAKATLHVDLNTLTHQRVFECVLSGGLPVLRLWADALRPAAFYVADELAERIRTGRGLAGASWSDWCVETEYGRALAREAEALGLPPLAGWDATDDPAALMPGHPVHRQNRVRPFDPLEQFGTLTDIAFADERSLERVLERCIEDRAWRAERSEAMRVRVRRHATTEVFAERLLVHCAQWLGYRERTRFDGFASIRGVLDEWLERARRA